jgi:hypothetical protein
MIGLGMFVLHPWLALLPSVGFAVLASRRRHVASWIAAAAWLLYAAYETAMARRILCSGECNIRIDLLVLYPALLLVSLVAGLLGRRGGRADA